MFFSVLIGYVLLHAANILCLKYLAFNGVSLPTILVFRGMGCLILVLAWAVFKQQSLRPKSLPLQSLRVLVAGTSLLLLTSAYFYIKGTSVGMISRMDVAILILLAPLVGESRTDLQRNLSLLLLLCFGGYAVFSNSSENPLGYFLAFMGTLGISLGFLLIKKSSTSRENLGVISGVAALSIVIVGLLASTFGGPLMVSHPLAPLAATSGVFMFFIYQMTVYLYSKMSVAHAEYPTLVAVLLVLPLEHWVMESALDLTYVSFILGAVVALGAIFCLKDRGAGAINGKPTALQMPRLRFLEVKASRRNQ